MSATLVSNQSPFGQMAQRRSAQELGALALAILLHVGFVAAALSLPPPAPDAAPLQSISLETEEVVDPPPPEEAAPEPEREVEPTPSNGEPRLATVTPGSTTSSESNDTPSATSDSPVTEEAAPLLTDPVGEADWAMLSGSGSALRGGGGRAKGSSTGTGRATTLAPRDFSRDPIAPALQPWVDRNFPAPARMYKLDGNVTISALINPDGGPSDVRVENVDPSGRGFGEACTRSILQGPAWQPKLNRDGRPLPARVTYTCRFRLSEKEKASSAPSEGAGANRVWSHSAGDAP